MSDQAAGAVAEAFGEFATWSAALFKGSPVLPGSRRALAAYELENTRIIDLDDPQNLVKHGLRPSQVVTRNRRVTQRWALDLFRKKRWGGVRWWSYYEPDWASFGLWTLAGLRVVNVSPLSQRHPAVQEAMRVLRRPWQ